MSRPPVFCSSRLSARLRSKIIDRVRGVAPGARKARWAAAACLAALSVGSPAFAQGPPGSSQKRNADVDDSSENGWGVMGQTGHLAFKTFGRNDSITPVEIMPYLLEDEHFFFGDVRGFVSNQAQFGGNVGLGYRYLDEGMMSWYGGNIWYDADNTTGQLFNQIGFGLEAAIEVFELRTNFYLPVGDTEKQFSKGTLAAHFQGNQLLFDSTSRFGTAMKGLDFEVGSSLPVPVGPFGSDLRGYLGGYFFNGNGVDNITGFKARAELDINHTVTTQVLYTNDGTFGSNVMVGAQLEFPWGVRHPSSSWKRAMPSPYRYVQRNYNVIVSETRSNIQNIVAINPATGLPYEVEHVSSTGTAGGDGSPNNAFATVGQAQAAGGDLIWVHAGTTLHEQITVQNGQFVLGESPGQTVVAQGYGTIRLPDGSTPGATTAPPGAPVISGVAGPAVTMGSNSTFAGFTIDNITGSGIVANGANNLTVRNVTLSDISGDGMRLTNSSGSVSIQDVDFQTIGGKGLMIDGGSANVSAMATFTNITGDAVTVQNTTGGTVTLTDVDISHTGGRGLVGTNLGSTFISENLTLTQITGDAIVFNGSTESVTFGGVTKIEDSLARGMVLNGLNPTEVADVTKAITIEDLEVTSSSTGAALSISNSVGNVIVKDMTLALTNGAGLAVDHVNKLTINKGTIHTTNNIAVDISNSNTDINLGWVDADHGTYGIRIIDSTGGFVVNGSGALGSGGTIQSMDTAVLLQNAGTVGLRYMNFVGNTNGIISSSTDYVVLDYLQVGSTTNYAVDSMNDSLHSISNSYFTGNGALGGGTIRYRSDTFGTYAAQIVKSTIVDKNGTPISYVGLAGSEGSSLNFLMDQSVVEADRGGVSAFNILWNGPIGLTMNGSQFTLGEANQTAVNVVGTSTTDRLTAAITNNIINCDDASPVGFHFVAAGTSTLNFGGNGVAFNGGNGVGMEFSLADQANVVLDTNAIVDNAFGGTGFLFDSIAAGSTVRIDGNTMNFKSTGVVVDRGIIFTTMGETVQLQGTRNNVIAGATTPFSAPSGKTTGSIRLNGVTVP